MKKLLIPTILAATIVIAGIFAFSPIDNAITVHTTITSAISISNMFADIDTALSTNNDAIIVDFVIIEQSGDVIEGLTAAAFATDFVAGADPGVVTITVDESGSGVYRLTIDPTNDWDAGRTDIALTATSGGISTTALIVVDID